MTHRFQMFYADCLTHFQLSCTVKFMGNSFTNYLTAPVYTIKALRVGEMDVFLRLMLLLELLVIIIYCYLLLFP